MIVKFNMPILSLLLVLIRRESWKGYATYDTWQMLLATAKQRAKDHSTLSDIYGQLIVNKLGDISEDLQRINKKVS